MTLRDAVAVLIVGWVLSAGAGALMSVNRPESMVPAPVGASAR
jgi:hypothetical protein